MSHYGIVFLFVDAIHPDNMPAVVNQGIGGRTLRDFCGPNAAARFDRDVLAVPDVTYVIVGLGLVDIILPTVSGNPSEVVSASDVIVGLKQLIYTIDGFIPTMQVTS